MSDLELALQTLGAKAGPYSECFNYYDGDQPLRYSTERLREVFKDITPNFIQNWAAVVVDAVADRLVLKSFQVTDDEKATKILNDYFEYLSIDIDARDIHKATMIASEGYLIAWKREDSDDPDVYYNDPRNCHLFPDESTPKKSRFAAKWYLDADGHRVVILYYPDRIEHYRAGKKESQGITTYKAAEFILDETQGGPNEYGRIPVFQFRRSLRGYSSELKNVVPIQDAINKIVADMMVCAEFQAFKQRWAITNANIGKVPLAPGSTIRIPASDSMSQPAEVGEFSESDLANYLKVLEQNAQAMAVITRTPKHYFFGQGGTPSGEALIAMEAPLNKKVSDYIERFTPVWREVGAFILKLIGIEIDADQIKPIFEEPQTLQPLTRSLIRQANTGAGIPIGGSLKMEGMTDSEIEEVLQPIEGTRPPEQNPIEQAKQSAAIIDQAAKNLEPVLNRVVETVGNLAIDNLLKTGAIDRLVKAKAPEVGGDA